MTRPSGIIQYRARARVCVCVCVCSAFLCVCVCLKKKIFFFLICFIIFYVNCFGRTTLYISTCVYNIIFRLICIM